MKFVGSPEKADAILVGFPVEQGTENKGCADAPSKVREALDNFYFSENAREKNVFDASDTVEAENFEKTMQKIESKIDGLLKYKKKIISIGGNHSITAPIITAFSKHYKKLGVVFIDAHPDCQKGYFPFGDVLSKIIELKIPVVLIGLRNWSKDEYGFLTRHKIPYLQAKDFSLEKAARLVKKYLGNSQIYLSIDIDAVDPVFAPGTGCIEPGGFSSRELLNLLYNIGEKSKVVGADLVEINVSRDINNMTSALGAKLILEIVDSVKG